MNEKIKLMELQLFQAKKLIQFMNDWILEPLEKNIEQCKTEVLVYNSGKTKQESFRYY